MSGKKNSTKKTTYLGKAEYQIILLTVFVFSLFFAPAFNLF